MGTPRKTCFAMLGLASRLRDTGNDSCEFHKHLIEDFETYERLSALTVSVTFSADRWASLTYTSSNMAIKVITMIILNPRLHNID